MVGLLQLPFELLATIFAGLDVHGLRALRLTSKDAKSVTLAAFTNRYFETRYVMLSRLSLENLVEVAQHPHFGPAIRTLEFCTDHFVEFPDPEFHTARHEGDILQAIREGRCQPAVVVDDVDEEHSGSDENGHSLPDDGQGLSEGSLSSLRSHDSPIFDQNAYQSLREEQEHIIHSGLAQAYVTLALSALANTTAVVIDSSHRPWGASRLSQQTGLPPTNFIDEFEEVPFVTHILRIVLTAVVTSGTSLASFAINIGLHRRAITPDALRLSEAHLQYYKNLPLSLTQLTLTVSAEAERGTDTQWTNDLLTFIGLFRQLSQLDLVINPGEFDTEINRLEQVALRLHVPNLQHLALYRVYCNAKELGVLLLKHRTTIQSMTLARVRISGGVGHWKSLFTLIRAHLPHLVLSIAQCFSNDRALTYRVGKGDGDEIVDKFDIGGDHEEWAKAIEAIETSL